MLMEMEENKEKVEKFPPYVTNNTICKKASTISSKSPKDDVNTIVPSETAVLSKLSTGNLQNQGSTKESSNASADSHSVVNSDTSQLSLLKNLSPDIDVSTISLGSSSTKTKSPDEVSFMKNMQVVKDVNQSDTAKVKIQPVFGHAITGRMAKLNGPFPVVYIGAPKYSNSKVNAARVEANVSNKSDDHGMADNCEEHVKEKDSNLLSNVNVDCRGSKAHSHGRTSVSAQNNSPEIKHLPSAIGIEVLEAKAESYDIQKAMDGFLQDSPPSVLESKFKHSLLKTDSSGSVPSLVISGPKAFEKQPFPFQVRGVPLRYSVPTAFISSHTPPIPVKNPQHRFSFPILKSAAVTKITTSVMSADMNKMKYQFNMNGVSSHAKILHRPTLSGGDGDKVVPSMKAANPIQARCYADANAGTSLPTVCKSTPNPPSVCATGDMKRKISVNVEDSLPKVARTDLVFKEKKQGVITVMKTTVSVPIKPSAKINVVTPGTTVLTKKTPPIPIAAKPVPSMQTNKNTSTRDIASDSTKTEIEPSSKKSKFPLPSPPPPPSLKKPGVLVKFEDHVQLWIDKLRDLMYLDDEPVTSWKIQKGTEVAARYTDGLFYDAVVLAAYEGPGGRERQKKSKIIKTNPPPAVDLPKESPPAAVVSSPGESPKTHLSPKVATPKTPENKVVEVCPATRNLTKEVDKNDEGHPRSSLLRVHIKKLDMSKDGSDSWNAKLIEDKSQSSLPSDQSSLDKQDSIHVKCSNCFVVFQTVALFRKHQNTVCHAKGVTVTGFKFEPNVVAKVDDKGSLPPLVLTFKNTVKNSNGMRAVPRNSEWKRCFRRGTHFLHRWQTDKGSKWYNGKILRLSKKGLKTDFDVKYLDDENDMGSIRICLYEDYPHDIRIVTR